MDGFWAVMMAYAHGKFKGPEGHKTIRELGKKYERHTPHKPIPIKFIGVFDTVASVGMPDVYFFNYGVTWINKLIKSYDEHYMVENTDLHPNIDYAYHAYVPIQITNDSLALNEARAPFSPNIWKVGPDNTHTVLKQVWFPGVHCSVGGGDTYRGLSSISLAWMIQKFAKRTNLEWNQKYVIASAHTFEPTIKGKKFDERSEKWACTPWDPSYVGIYHLAGHKLRTPGKYHDLQEGERTNETIHHSVTVRKENMPYTHPSLTGLVMSEFGELEKELKEKFWSVFHGK
jgi:hypothetical protein